MQRGFFASLFDVSFRSLITPRIIKVIYILAMVLIGIMTLIGVIAALVTLADEPAAGIVFLILVPIFALLYLVYARVALEVVIALFHIMQNSSELVRLGGGRPATSGVFAAPAIASMPAATGVGGQPGAPPPGGEAGWYSDPQGQARLRYWDGAGWTEHTSA
jgi:hypothetical protein